VRDNTKMKQTGAKLKRHHKMAQQHGYALKLLG